MLHNNNTVVLATDCCGTSIYIREVWYTEYMLQHKYLDLNNDEREDAPKKAYEVNIRTRGVCYNEFYLEYEYFRTFLEAVTFGLKARNRRDMKYTSKMIDVHPDKERWMNEWRTFNNMFRK